MNLYKNLEKKAAVKLPANPKQWETQVLKSIKNQHPYVELTDVGVKFEIFEPEEGRASGIVTIKNKIAAPFTIRPDNKTGKSELDNIDVMFSNGSFKHFNEFSYSEAITEGASPSSGLNGRDNFYVGKMTGDVSPLEFGAYPHGGMSSFAGCGLLSSVVRNMDDVSRLFNLLNMFNGINTSVQRLGLSDTLNAIRSDVRDEPTGNRSAVISFDATTGNFKVRFDGDNFSSDMPPNDLRAALGPNYKSQIRQLMAKGWIVVSDMPTMRTVSYSLSMDRSAPLVSFQGFLPIERSGKFNLSLMGSQGVVKALVACKQRNFNGTTSNIQSAITEGGIMGISRKFVGIPIQTKGTFIHPQGGSELRPGAEGVFMDESFGGMMFTPKIKIKKITLRPDRPAVITAINSDDGSEIGIVLLDQITKPSEVTMRHMANLDVDLPERSYYVPTAYPWIEVKGFARFDSVTPELSVDSANITKTASGQYSWAYSDELAGKYIQKEDLILKLASLGADQDTIQSVLDTPNGKTGTFKGFNKNAKKSTVAKYASKSNTFDLSEIKKYAEQAIEGINSSQVEEDPKIVDAILSIQFISDDTLSDLVASLPMFDEVEDKVAKLLMAARQGEQSIDESGCERALKGIGGVRKSLRNLAIEIEAKQKK